LIKLSISDVDFRLANGIFSLGNGFVFTFVLFCKLIQAKIFIAKISFSYGKIIIA